jgi:hypothetical protein
VRKPEKLVLLLVLGSQLFNKTSAINSLSSIRSQNLKTALIRLGNVAIIVQFSLYLRCMIPHNRQNQLRIIFLQGVLA